MKRASLAVFALLVLATVAHMEAQNATSRNTYPNELPGFKFYVKYLSPLHPNVSDKAAVIQVLGSDQGKTVDGWRFWPLYVGDAAPANGRLAEVRVIPQKRISMRGVRFPAVFTRGKGGVSEINVTCDVYTDNNGLQYWLYAEDSRVAKKADLMHIVYGATKEARQQSPSAPR